MILHVYLNVQLGISMDTVCLPFVSIFTYFVLVCFYCSTEIMSNDPTDIDNAPSPALVILDYLLLVSSALYYAIDQ